MTMNLDEKLLKLKQQIGKAEQTRMQAEAEVKQLTKTLKDEYGVSTVEAAEKKLRQMQKEQKEIEDEIAEKVEELEGVLA
jgi:hypothetical protein